jgi:hypothetical protein
MPETEKKLCHHQLARKGIIKFHVKAKPDLHSNGEQLQELLIVKRVQGFGL